MDEDDDIPPLVDAPDTESDEEEEGYEDPPRPHLSYEDLRASGQTLSVDISFLHAFTTGEGHCGHMVGSPFQLCSCSHDPIDRDYILRSHPLFRHFSSHSKIVVSL
jgi:hypothetical protein